MIANSGVFGLKARNIHTIALHEKAHVEELVAARLLQRIFPDAKIVFMSEREFEKITHDPGVIGIGLGGGECDEHKENGDRLPGACALTLTVNTFDLAVTPGVMELAAEGLKSDIREDEDGNEYPQHETEWGELVKTLHNFGDVGEEWVLNFISAFVDTYLGAAAGEPAREIPQLTLDPEICTAFIPGSDLDMIVIPDGADMVTHLNAWLLKVYGGKFFNMKASVPIMSVKSEEELLAFKGKRAFMVGFDAGHLPAGNYPVSVMRFLGYTNKHCPERKRVRKLLKIAKTHLEKPGGTRPMELPNLVAIMKRSLPTSTMVRWLGTVFTAYVNSGIDFHERCPRDLNKYGQVEDVDYLRVAIVSQTTAMSMPRFTRSQPTYVNKAWKTADVTVIDNPYGRQVFVNKKYPGLDVAIAQEIMDLQLMRAGIYGRKAEAIRRTFTERQAMGRDFNLPAPAEMVYFKQKGNMILIGSITHPLSREEHLRLIPHTLFTQAVFQAVSKYTAFNEKP